MLADGKRETTTSLLAINPTDLDIGRVFSCRSTNDAIPAGKETFVKLNVHRESAAGTEGMRPGGYAGGTGAELRAVVGYHGDPSPVVGMLTALQAGLGKHCMVNNDLQWRLWEGTAQPSQCAVMQGADIYVGLGTQIYGR